MGRPPRVDAGGFVYHVLNRANSRLTIFREDGDYQAFENVMAEGVARTEMRVIAYTLMPNHWHFVLWPQHDGELSRFVGWLSLTHTQRWHAHRESAGHGHLYQGRFKSFLIQTDDHFLTVCRYVERNPLRAGLVERAEAWCWSSLYHWQRNTAMKKVLAAEWPEQRPDDWLFRVNEAQTPEELQALRHCVRRAQPYGSPDWQAEMISRFGLESILRSPGRPLGR